MEHANSSRVAISLPTTLFCREHPFAEGEGDSKGKGDSEGGDEGEDDGASGNED